MPELGLPTTNTISCFLLSLVLCGAGFTAPLDSAEKKQLRQVLGPRPQIQNYYNQEDFVTDLLAWQRQRKALRAKLKNGEAIQPQAKRENRDWHHITGPEDLETALENARGYEQPHYQQPLRFNRTTHLSFPLPRLPQQQLSDKTIQGLDAPPPMESDEEIPEKLLEQTERIQRQTAASRTATPPPATLHRRRHVSNVEAR